MAKQTLRDAVELFVEYSIIMQQLQVKGFHGYLAHEALERLEQLDFLVSEIARFQDVLFDYSLREGDIDYKTDPHFQLALLSDSFYFIAFRFIEIANGPDKPLPGLFGLNAPGIRNVRNHLLAHPEGRRSRMFSRSWLFGGIEGPVMKPGRALNEPPGYTDRGLFVNAAELAAAVCNRLHTKMRSLTAAK